MKFFHSLRRLAGNDYLGHAFFGVFYLACWLHQGHDPFMLAGTIAGPFLIDCLKGLE